MPNLTETESKLLELFANDTETFEVVKKGLLSSIEVEKRRIVDTTNFNMTNEDLGAQLRSIAMAIVLITGAFRELGQHKTPVAQPEKINPAR